MPKHTTPHSSDIVCFSSGALIMLSIKPLLLIALAAGLALPAATIFSGASSSAFASDPPGPNGSSAVSVVSCSGTACSVTLAGNGSSAQVFDTEIAFVGIRDGRATVRVANQDVSCVQGQTLTAGSLTLACTSVTSDTVRINVSPA
jgi:hypothetical protein